MKKFLVYMRPSFMVFAFVCASHFVAAQQLWMEKDGYTRFFSETVAYDIEAKNHESASVINADTHEIAVKIPINKFKFENALMEEHFNENYMESAQFPTATFKGKINGNVDWQKKGEYPVTATGVLTMHGQAKDVTFSGTIAIEGDKAVLKSSFDVMLVDYGIKIPTMMFSKIAEKIQVTAEYTYQKYVK